MSSTAQTATTARDPKSVALALVQLTKPGITRMVLITTAAGAVVTPVSLHLPKLLVALFGTALVVGSANALNMYLERDVDGAMERTAGRPLPSGRLAPETALWFGIALGVVGLFLLTFLVNLATGILGAVALVSYALVYTPLKRVTPYALHVGTIPGAIPPLIGWAAVTGSLSLGALPLFAILLVWQLPHFLAISLFRQADYERAGLCVYSSVYGEAATRRAIVSYSILLAAVSVAPPLLGVGGLWYTVFAAILGASFVTVALLGLRGNAGVRWARTVFYASLPYLVLISGALVVAAL